KPQPTQTNQLADGVLLSVLTLDIAEDDLSVQFEPWQDLKEASLQLTDGKGRGFILHGSDLLLGTASAPGGPVRGNRYRPGTNAGHVGGNKKTADRTRQSCGPRLGCQPLWEPGSYGLSHFILPRKGKGF